VGKPAPLFCLGINPNFRNVPKGFATEWKCKVFVRINCKYELFLMKDRNLLGLRWSEKIGWGAMRNYKKFFQFFFQIFPISFQYGPFRELFGIFGNI
jgi:hypothetical protein